MLLRFTWEDNINNPRIKELTGLILKKLRKGVGCRLDKYTG
jgi:hypothetical protein